MNLIYGVVSPYCMRDNTIMENHPPGVVSVLEMSSVLEASRRPIIEPFVNPPRLTSSRPTQRA